jgi:hypothetical protein
MANKQAATVPITKRYSGELYKRLLKVIKKTGIKQSSILDSALSEYLQRFEVDATQKQES